MKKLFSFILTFGILFSSLLIFNACGSSYHKKAGKIEELVGTYELTTYNKKDADGNSYDYKTPNSISAYMTINSNGRGYYVYKQGSNITSETIAIKFNYNSEDDTLIDSIEYTNGSKHFYYWDMGPGKGEEPKMGFNVNTHTLNYTLYEAQKSTFVSHDIEYSTATYTRISNDTSLSTIESKIGTTINEQPIYELKNIQHPLVLRCNEQSDYYDAFDYYIIDLNTVTGKADIYYKLKTGNATTLLSTNENNNFSISINTSVSGYNHAAILKTNEITSHDFYLDLDYELKPSSSFFYTDYDGDGGTGYKSEYFEQFYGDYTTINDIITALTTD